MPRPSVATVSRRRTRHVIAGFGALALTATALSTATATATGDSNGDAGRGGGDRAENAYVEAQLADMTIEEKVGQMFVVQAYGSDAHTVAPEQAAKNQFAYGVDTPAEVVEKYHLGGVIYFAWTDSLADLNATAQLSNDLQATAIGDDDGPPLLISTDQESGVVVRLVAPATPFPGSQALGAGGRTRDARRAAEITAEELRAVGINQNFAPVADVNVNPANPVIGVRSFGSDPQSVADFVVAQVEGYQRRDGVAAAAKHFPGHGDTNEDSHTDLPVIDHTREEWETLDRPPFAAAVESGIDVIMTAHIVVESLDPSGDPATLSKPIMTGILREEMGFDGVVITDALQMDAIREQYGPAEVPVLTIQAGVDQLLMPKEGEMDLSVAAVLDAVESGEISEARIDQSVERILRLKWRRGIVDDPFVDADRVDRVLGSKQHLKAAQRITDRTITALRNDDSDGTAILPTDVEGQDVLVTGTNAGAAALAESLTERGADVELLMTGSRPSDPSIAAATTAAENADLTVVLTNKAWDTTVTDPEARQQRLVTALGETGTPTVALAVRDAYDVAYLPEDVGYLASYSTTTVSMESVAKVVTGELSPAGELPVDVPAPDGSILYPIGSGLHWR